MQLILIGIFLILGLFNFGKIRVKRWEAILLFVFCFLLILTATFRPEGADRDYRNYKANFDRSYELGMELSFTWIKNAVKTFFPDSFWMLLFVYALLGVSLKVVALKKLTPLVLLSLLVYVSQYFILHEMTQIRAGIASSFLLLCIKPIYERKFLQFVTLVAIATFFHISGLVILPFWFLRKKGLPPWLLASLIPLGYILYYTSTQLLINFPVEYIQLKFATYQELQEDSDTSYSKINIFNVLFLIKCALFYILLFSYKKMSIQNIYFKVMMNLYAVSLFSLPAFAFMPVLAFRFNELFGIVDIVLIPFIIYLFRNLLVGRIIVIALAFFTLLLNLLYSKLIV